MTQIGRNLTGARTAPSRASYILMDRDTKFSEAFRTIWKMQASSRYCCRRGRPNLNAHLERFHRVLKEECLDRMISLASSHYHIRARVLGRTTTRAESSRLEQPPART